MHNFSTESREESQKSQSSSSSPFLFHSQDKTHNIFYIHTPYKHVCIYAWLIGMMARDTPSPRKAVNAIVNVTIF